MKLLPWQHIMDVIIVDAKYLKVLKKAFLFAGINGQECDRLIKCLDPNIKRFSKHEILIHTGDYIYQIGVVLTGSASAYLEHADGSQTIISSLSSKSVFGEILVSTRQHKSPVTVYATSDIVAAYIDYQQLFSMCASACTAHRIFLQNLLKAIGDKYFRMFDRITILQERSLRDKILAYLHALQDEKDTKTVTIPFTKTMLASYLLANRCALTKELRKLQDEGIISVNGREVELHQRMYSKRPNND